MPSNFIFTFETFIFLALARIKIEPERVLLSLENSFLENNMELISNLLKHLRRLGKCIFNEGFAACCINGSLKFACSAKESQLDFDADPKGRREEGFSVPKLALAWGRHSRFDVLSCGQATKQ
jgi:hypothetical protein